MSHKKKKKKMPPAWCILFDLWKHADAWKAKRRETGQTKEGRGVQGDGEREALVSSSNARLCHLTPATEWA